MKFMDKDDFEKQNVFGTGQANTAYAKYFIGDSFLNPLTDPKCGLFLANVTFEPGCRNNWHIHHATKGGGQMLICTAGEGWYQEEGKEPVSLVPGTVIAIPPEVKHWHGAKKDSWFSHIAAEIPGENTSNEWWFAICQGAFLQNTMFLKIAFKIYAEPLVRRGCELSAQWFSFICNHYFSNSRYSCPMKKIFNSF